MQVKTKNREHANIIGACMLPWEVYCERCAPTMPFGEMKEWAFVASPFVCFKCRKAYHRC